MGLDCANMARWINVLALIGYHATKDPVHTLLRRHRIIRCCLYSPRVERYGTAALLSITDG
ncbi:MAG: hypothetical protein ACRDRB_06270, partial [Pseudonocardiaceae bacterium]